MTADGAAPAETDDDAPAPGAADASVQTAVEAAILALTAARGPDKSICPSEAARAAVARLSLEPAAGWRALSADVRAVAEALARAGRIEARQRGAPVQLETARGPYRLAAPRLEDPTP